MRYEEILRERADDRYLAMLNLPVRLEDGGVWPVRLDEVPKYVNQARLKLKRQDRIVWAMRIFRVMLAIEMLDLVRRERGGGIA